MTKLIAVFGETTVLDTTAFFKTIKRQRAVITTTGRISWKSSPTVQNTPVDELLEHNWSAVKRCYDLVSCTAHILNAA